VVERDSRETVHIGEGHRRAVGSLPEGNVEGVAVDGVAVLDGGIIADQAKPEYLRIRGTNHVYRAYETDTPFGERAGLIREQDLDVTEILDAHETLDQYSLAGKTTRSGRETGRHHRGEQLGRDPHRDRQ